VRTVRRASGLGWIVLGLVLLIQVFAPGALAAHRSASRTIDVTYADNGDSYRLPVGDSLDVTLSGPSTVFSWSEPVSSNNAALQRESGSSGTTATGVFLTVGKGKATVTALGSPKCSQVCTDVIVLFEVKVEVSGKG